MKKATIFALFVFVSSAAGADWKERVADAGTQKTVKIDIYGTISPQFFGVSMGTYSVHGACSGVFVDPKGMVLTAAHCFAGDGLTISTITVTTFSNKAIDVSKNTIYMDSHADLALIVPNNSEFSGVRYAEVASYKQAIVAQDVLAIGHPLGLDWTVTTGIVSNVTRLLAPNGFFTQFDAVIAPGSSGGPVFDRKGALIGIVSRYKSGPMGSLTGLNFMVELSSLRTFIDMVKQLTYLQKRIRRYRIGDIR